MVRVRKPRSKSLLGRRDARQTAIPQDSVTCPAQESSSGCCCALPRMSSRRRVFRGAALSLHDVHGSIKSGNRWTARLLKPIRGSSQMTVLPSS